MDINNPFGVKTEQLWKDNNKKRNERTIMITKVNSRYAYGFCLESNRKTRISLDRFNNYTLIARKCF